uniref:Uncharacterized protein n=1 Tax=Anguilla anguilla TaxID=7936 RepID=A0A0E9QWA1_ANGAN
MREVAYSLACTRAVLHWLGILCPELSTQPSLLEFSDFCPLPGLHHGYSMPQSWVWAMLCYFRDRIQDL